MMIIKELHARISFSFLGSGADTPLFDRRGSNKRRSLYLYAFPLAHPGNREPALGLDPIGFTGWRIAFVRLLARKHVRSLGDDACPATEGV